METFSGKTRLKHRNHRLKSRIIVAFSVLGLAVSCAFAIVAYKTREIVESQLVDDSLRKDAASYARRIVDKPGYPYFGLIQAWAYSPNTLHRAPPDWRAMKPGIYLKKGIVGDSLPREYKLIVSRERDITVYLTYDVTRGRAGKVRLAFFLIALVGILSVSSLVLGILCASAVIRPLGNLADCLRDRQYGFAPSQLASHFADDEVGELALAFDRYAEKLTEVVERDKKFNCDVSHELRTPLAIIGSSVELILSSPELSGKLHERCLRIQRACRQASDTTEALLMLSRSERGNQACSEVSHAEEIVRRVVEANSLLAEKKGLEIEVQIVAKLTISIPNAVFGVMVGNLVGNAVKYTFAGSITIEVHSRGVRVIDTGIGIDKEDEQALFTRGVQVDPFSAAGGAGLGLEIVRRLCGLYGWTVSLAPRQDRRGTVASLFIIPACKDDEISLNRRAETQS